ncbi:hypothetical protein AVEN_29204-1 [Araneus ventricosus]|uniref:Uncharacterized protein n=1 Tax=Araneus ventricosus TaxID=182803 RepID=A0A4Y2ALZ0_ARAVE|nr:hypothetical protein AVEN_29204-1 [Araneus ventricosus]
MEACSSSNTCQCINLVCPIRRRVKRVSPFRLLKEGQFCIKPVIHDRPTPCRWRSATSHDSIVQPIYLGRSFKASSMDHSDPLYFRPPPVPISYRARKSHFLSITYLHRPHFSIYGPAV